jgi:alanine racemase
MESDERGGANWARLKKHEGARRSSKEGRGKEGRAKEDRGIADNAFNDATLDGFHCSIAPLSTRFDRAEALLSRRALVSNYEAITELVPGQALLPMVKADAYGHGAKFAVRALASAKDLYGFGTASLDEAREVREVLGVRGRNTRVLSLSGAVGWSEEKGQYCEHFGITPTIASEDDWRAFYKGGWPERLKYHLKFNTGMNRLGLAPGMAKQILSQLAGKPGEWRPEGVATHMAVAEDADHPLTRRQIESFRGILSDVRSGWSDTLFHLANSSSIWNAKKLGLEGMTDIVRPGISLYGVPPWKDAPLRGLTPVMELRYCVAARRVLKPGESIGYGARFRLKGNDSPLEVAILATGYADGLHRMNSGVPSGERGGGDAGGRVLLGGKLRRFLGVVSMDLSAVECDASVCVGDWARILGDGLDPWTQAAAAGTIPYELLTSISRRVRKTEV